MLCEVCKKNIATIKMVKINKGESETINVCTTCAQKENSPLVNDIREAMGLEKGAVIDLIKSQIANAPMSISCDLPTKVCVKCGLTEEKYNKHGEFHCENCIKIFMEVDEVHKGKSPNKSVQEVSLERKIEYLEEKLKICVFKEEFEKAALLRDEIIRIQGEKK